jgi:hypothetical protein
LDRPLEATPWSAGIPPQDCKDREQCPPQSVGCLVGDYREDDADHDADQRHEAADVVVFAAASLKNALDDAAKAYEAKTGDKIVVSYAASSALAKQIEGVSRSRDGETDQIPRGRGFNRRPLRTLRAP